MCDTRGTMVLKYTGEELYKSTYTSLYKKTPCDTKRRIKFNELPHLTGDCHNQVKSRTHYDYIATKKFARLPGLAHDDPPCLGLGSHTSVPLYNTEKAIVRMKPPQDQKIKFKTEKQVSTAPEHEDLEDVIVRLRWVPTKKREEQGNINNLPVPKWKIPDTTLEHPFLMSKSPRRYERSAEDWQIVSRAWDRVQMRPLLGNRKCKSMTLEKKNVALEQGDVAKSENAEQGGDSFNFNMANQCKVRKLPHYGGFVPKEPVDTSTDKSSAELYRSSAERVYRSYPHHVMHNPRTQAKHRQAPLSKMVTIVYPCNPFKITPSTTQTCINPIYQNIVSTETKH